jgi:hypothetical protein
MTADTTQDPADRAELLAEIKQAVMADIREVNAERQAEERVRGKVLARCELCMLPLAVFVIVYLQIVDRAILAEAAALIPNLGLVVLRISRHIF